MIRNLICHIYPRRAGQKWRRTADHLNRRAGLFNGRKILTVATDDTCDDLETVKQAFEPLDAEFLHFRNTELQEGLTFIPAMDLVASTREDEVTFRCHSKGCTHQHDAEASHRWADAMFEVCCDYPDLIDAMLCNVAIVGPFRSLGLWPFPGMHGWHYAGSFYWFRHDRTFSRNWRFAMPTFWAAEAWPGVFPLHESDCLFFDRADTAHLYNTDYWHSNITPSLTHWRNRVKACINGTAREVCREPADIAG